MNCKPENEIDTVWYIIIFLLVVSIIGLLLGLFKSPVNTDAQDVIKYLENNYESGPVSIHALSFGGEIWEVGEIK